MFRVSTWIAISGLVGAWLAAGTLVASAQGPEGKVLIQSQIPIGDERGGIIAIDSVVTALLQVESQTEADLQVEYTLEIPKPLRPTGVDSGSQVTEGQTVYLVSESFQLVTENDRWWKVLRIQVPADVIPGPVPFISTVKVTDTHNGKSWSETQVDQALAIEKSDLVGLIEVISVEFPTDELGNVNKVLPQGNAVMVETTSSPFQRFFGRRSELTMRPTGWASVRLRSKADVPITVNIAVDFLDLKTGQKAPGFLPPPEADYVGDRIQVLKRLQGNSVTRVGIPIWARVGDVLPGKYEMRVSVEHLGTGTVVANVSNQTQVVDTKRTQLTVTLVALLSAMAGFVFLFVRRYPLLWKAPTRHLVMVALFVTAIFGAVTLPFMLIEQILDGLLGPFSSLIRGFFNEVVFYILLMSLVVLIPKPGIVTLFGVVHFLLRGILTSGLGPYSLVVSMFPLITLEAALWLMGITRGKRLEGELEFSVPRVLGTALVLGVIDAYNTFLYFNFLMFTRRLYLADWYLGMQILIVGFLFTAVAVPPGLKLGARLRKIAAG